MDACAEFTVAMIQLAAGVDAGVVKMIVDERWPDRRRIRDDIAQLAGIQAVDEADHAPPTVDPADHAPPTVDPAQSAAPTAGAPPTGSWRARLSPDLLAAVLSVEPMRTEPTTLWGLANLTPVTAGSRQPARAEQECCDLTETSLYVSLADGSRLRLRGSLQQTHRGDLKSRGVLGSGGQATVWKVFNEVTKQTLALKVITVGDSVSIAKALQSEVRHVLEPEHANLVKSIDAFYGNGKLEILMEFMHYGSLFDLSRSGVPMPEAVLSRITAQVLCALNHLHTGGSSGCTTIHRDVKPGNILVNDQGTVKVADFGICKVLPTPGLTHTAYGTTRYMSPERLRQEGYTTACDIWAVGVTVAELSLGDDQAVSRGHVRWPSELPTGRPPGDGLKNFVAQCLQQRPAHRPPAGELLRHPFITDHEGEPADIVLQWCRGVSQHAAERTHSSIASFRYTTT
eukprot:TRINITY_DN3526_c0_g2_i1.p1 TRINITY_DN3526_c0_g2~~TRINITY_DN3526_c0_g2_i1.p1  ORF type:complete len:474 (+),score=10.51 TRINITY_DN3526_c0_g2_i1:56-1423(+)